jgi:hypothetical protein
MQRSAWVEHLLVLPNDKLAERRRWKVHGDNAYKARAEHVAEVDGQMVVHDTGNGKRRPPWEVRGTCEVHLQAVWLCNGLIKLPGHDMPLVLAGRMPILILNAHGVPIPRHTNLAVVPIRENKDPSTHFTNAWKPPFHEKRIAAGQGRDQAVNAAGSLAATIGLILDPSEQDLSRISLEKCCTSVQDRSQRDTAVEWPVAQFTSWPNPQVEKADTSPELGI